MATVLIVGSGAREHALGHALSEAAGTHRLVFLPGNAGTAALGRNVEGSVLDTARIVEVARECGANLVVIGPEAPLVAGAVDALEAALIPAFGPTQACAALEGSKIFMKEILRDAGIRTAPFRVFDQADEAERYAQSENRPLVVKADGLCAGKGVVVATSADEAVEAIDRMMRRHEFGAAGARVVIEDLVPGEEASFHVVTDGRNYVTLAPAQDHKRVFDGDRGPNTGGMGAYAPAPIVTPQIHETVCREVVEPLLRTMQERGLTFRGVLFAGLMIHDGVPWVLEFNVRFGDPETSVILPLHSGDLYELLASSARGSLVAAPRAATPSAGAALAVVMAAEGYPGAVVTGDAIAGLDAVVAHRPATVLHAGTRHDGDAIVTSGGRVLVVVARGDSLTAAHDSAYRAVDAIAWRGEHHRRDIGARALGPKSSLQ
jgi:phosphoribosylamine--glycine ligase